MTETLPRSFTVSTAAHALVVAVGLVVASDAVVGRPSDLHGARGGAGDPRGRRASAARARGHAPAARAADPAAPEPARCNAARPSAPTPAPTIAPVAPAAPSAPAAPAPVLTAEGGDPSMAASSQGAST
ncbi:MAG: hypothetical protein U0325_34420 [Polyangiales bacterium]